MFRRSYGDVFAATSAGRGCRARGQPLRVGQRLDLHAQADVPRRHDDERRRLRDIAGARVLAVLGDSVTTDHISPAGSIKADTPREVSDREGREAADFNSYGARRGNHEVMMRGTFANVRLRNQMAPGTEGGWTTYQPAAT
jgi:aconitate hydratase